MNAFDNTLILFASDNGASAEIMVRHGGHDPQSPTGERRFVLVFGAGFFECRKHAASSAQDLGA